MDCTWIAINEQPVAYYHEATVDDGESYSITGRIPVLYNDDRAELVVEFTDIYNQRYWTETMKKGED